MRSCSALEGGAELEAHAANSERSEMVTAHFMSCFFFFSFVARDVSQVSVLSPIAWKRRVNQQEIHQLSIYCHFQATVSY